MTMEHLVNARIETCVDFVFVIDATNSMTTLIETMEKGVLTFYETMRTLSKHLTNVTEYFRNFG